MQRLPARLVTTPQTVHSFTRESSAGGLARSIRLAVLGLGDDVSPYPHKTRGVDWTIDPGLGQAASLTVVGQNGIWPDDQWHV